MSAAEPTVNHERFRVLSAGVGAERSLQVENLPKAPPKPGEQELFGEDTGQ